jgi:hypothetical protein
MLQQQIAAERISDLIAGAGDRRRAREVRRARRSPATRQLTRYGRPASRP